MEWQLQEAKAKFSELVERAMAGDAQVVTRRGKPAVVIIPIAEYERLQGGKTAWDLFKSAPRCGDDIGRIDRDQNMVLLTDLG